eukprot:CAMPEP_0198693244 /NCGR_PEP_ID=MMETSP1468-20131203/246529_1 /TAXON_ID=1461545 /ORGANISM="Mantoniella sp, Strain CCMP1436" /LENGTH=56 /DNA_ID=CAMNT_0044447773 /DNA_START=191 /DNA_END=357 /DNA_ORIENTATION=-
MELGAERGVPADVVLVLERELLEGPAERGQLRAHHVHAAPLLHLAHRAHLQLVVPP